MGFQADLALQRGLISPSERHSIQRLIEKLPQRIPEQPAAIIHGDLWSGNDLFQHNGVSVLIDPAAHRGWAEADIAMSTLFGCFPDEFYRAYLEINPLLPGWRDRFAFYSLYPLLNHTNLLGNPYQQHAMAVVRQLS